jgi:hypothetical protein
MRTLASAGLLVIMLTRPIATALAQEPNLSVPRAEGPVADTLRGFALRMAELLRSRDARGTLGLYGDTAHFVHVENGNVIPWSRLSAMVTAYFDSATDNPVWVVGEPGVTRIDAHNAVLYVTHRSGGEGRVAHAGVWTGVLHRFPEGWRIVHSHSSDRTATD